MNMSLHKGSINEIENYTRSHTCSMRDYKESQRNLDLQIKLSSKDAQEKQSQAEKRFDYEITIKTLHIHFCIL